MKTRSAPTPRPFAHFRRTAREFRASFFKLNHLREERMSDHVIVAGEESRQERGVFPASGQAVLARAGELVLLCELSVGQGWQTGSLLDTLSAVAADGADGAELSHRLTSLV